VKWDWVRINRFVELLKAGHTPARAQWADLSRAMPSMTAAQCIWLRDQLEPMIGYEAMQYLQQWGRKQEGAPA
jgi:hypothetical protein